MNRCQYCFLNNPKINRRIIWICNKICKFTRRLPNTFRQYLKQLEVKILNYYDLKSLNQIKMKNIFLKQVLFTPLDRIRFTCGSGVQLKNNTPLYCSYKRVGHYKRNESA